MKTDRSLEQQVVDAVNNGTLEVDNHGRIWRVKKRGWDRWLQRAVDRPCRRVRAEHNPGNGYLQVRLMLGKRRAHVSAHRIVFRVKVGEIPPGLTINHKNGDKADNRPENLELATYSEQIRHAKIVLGKLFKHQDGEKNDMAKLTEGAVREIRTRRAAGEQLKSIASAFGISDRTVSKIAHRTRWASIS